MAICIRDPANNKDRPPPLAHVLWWQKLNFHLKDLKHPDGSFSFLSLFFFLALVVNTPPALDFRSASAPHLFKWVLTDPETAAGLLPGIPLFQF